MKRFAIIWFSFLALWGCNTKQEGAENGEKILQASDTIAIAIDSTTSYNSGKRATTIDGKTYLYEYIVFSRHAPKSYGIFDLQQRKMIKKIVFPQEGTKAVSRYAKVVLHNFDSIFVIEPRKKAISLYDSTQNLKQKWFLDTAQTGRKIGALMVYIQAEPFFQNAKLFLLHYFYPFYTEENFRDTLEVVFDLETGIASNRVGTHPAIYTESKFYGNDSYATQRIVTKEDKIVYGFGITDSIYVYDQEKQIAVYALPSTYVSDPAPDPGTLTYNDHEKSREYFVRKGTYALMRYDPYRDLIYRVVLHPAEPYDQQGNMIDALNKPFSIQVIDENFNLIGEQPFPGNTYDIFNIIAVPQGLLISTSNNKNPALQEDQLQFVLFEVNLPKTN